MTMRSKPLGQLMLWTRNAGMIEPRKPQPRFGISRWTIWLLFGLAVCGVARPVAAQETPATPEPAPADGAAAEADWEKLIYVPYRNLKDVFEKHGSTIFMPYAEYLKRWQEPVGEQKAVVEAVVTESHYQARVDRSLLRIDAELTVQVLGKPWVAVPIKFGQAAVGKLTAEEGKQVLLKGTGDGTYSLLFGQAGAHRVTLELAVPIKTSPDGRSTEFSVPPVGVTTFELSVPEADQTIEVAPHLVSLPVEAADTETRIKANLGSTTKIAASWHPKTGLKPDMALLAAVTNYQKVTLRDGLAHTDAWLTYDVLRGEMNELAIAVPTGHRILGVTSGDAKIRGLKTEAGDDGQTVTVEFLSPVRSKVTIEVHTEREISADPLELIGRDDGGAWNGIHAIDAVRESGQVAVSAAGDLSLQFEQVTGLARIEDAEISSQLKQPGIAAFKFYSSNIQLRVLAKPVEPRLLVDSVYEYEFKDDEVQLGATLNYRIERAGVFELRIGLPEGFEVDAVNEGSGLLREHLVEDEDGAKVLRVVLQRKTDANSALTLNVRGHVEFEEAAEEVEVTLPIPEPLSVEREVAQLYVFAPEAIDVITDQETIVSAQPLPVQQVQQRADLRTAGAWTFNRRPVEIPLRTQRRPTRLTANVGTTITVKEETVEIQSKLTYLVQFAGLDTFRFTVPENVSEGVKIVSLGGPGAPGIKQKVADDEAVDGWVTWTITMQRDVSGSHPFQVSWDQKPNGDGDEAGEEGDAAPAPDAGSADGPKKSEIVFQTLRVLGLDGSEENEPEVALSDVSGEIVVRKDRALSVSATTLDDGLEAIDVRELSLLPQTGALAYRYYRQPVGLQLTSTKHEIQKVVETVVMRGLVEIVARRDPRASYRCRYRIRSSERQRLKIDVPVGSELLGMYVNGEPVNPEKDERPHESEFWQSYFINVARSAASDEPFSLTIQLMTPIAGEKKLPFESWGGPLELRLPQIGGLGNHGVAVQQLNTRIWVPEDYRLVGDADGFINETKLNFEEAIGGQWDSQPYDWLDVESWIEVPRAGFIDFPTEGNRFRYSSLGGAPSIEVTFANRPNYTWLYSGALLVLAVLLRGLSWDTKTLLLLITGFAAVLFGLSSPGWAAEILSSARVGLFGLVGIWVLHAVFTWRGSSGDGTSSPDDKSSPPVMGSGSPAVVPPPGVFDDLRKQFGN